MRLPSPHRPLQSQDGPLCQLGNFPGGDGHLSPGPFLSRSPLAKLGPSLAPFWAGWGHSIRRIWPDWRAFLGDLIGAACVFALPISLLFLEFLT